MPSFFNSATVSGGLCICLASVSYRQIKPTWELLNADNSIQNKIGYGISLLGHLVNAVGLSVIAGIYAITKFNAAGTLVVNLTPWVGAVLLSWIALRSVGSLMVDNRRPFSERIKTELQTPALLAAYLAVAFFAHQLN